MSSLVGLYYFQGILLDVRQSKRGLIASVPGLPAGYEIRFEPVDDAQFRIVGGAVSGATVSFTEQGIALGPMLIERIDSAETLPVTRFSTAPQWTPSAEQTAAFDTLLDSVGDGDWFDYNLPYPKHQFLQYATTLDRFIFHGSNNQSIDRFAPERKSVELKDETGRGNRQAVYGTHEALWSLFFAIVDRKRLHGSIRNGISYYYNAANEPLSLFNFSINSAQLADAPYCDGAVYFLPRDTFERIPLFGTLPSNEWGSEQPVKPLAKLRVSRDDFPFEIHGHDDGELLRLQALTQQLREAAGSAELTPSQFTVRVAEPFPFDEFIRLQKQFMPTVQYVQGGDGATLTATNLPPALASVLRDDYADLLSEQK